MKVVSTFVFIFFTLALANDCYNGDLYVVTQEGRLYQANLDGTINSKYIQTECVIENGVSKTNDSLLFSCYLEDDTAILTITDNKVENTAIYDHDSFNFCTLNPIAYGGNGIVWGLYSEIYLLNDTHGFIEGNVVSIKQSTGEILEKTSFIWQNFGANKRDSDNGTCLFNTGQYYAFKEGDILYLTASSKIASFNVATNKAVLIAVSELLDDGQVIDSVTYDSEHKMLYAVSKSNLYRFSVDDNMNFELINSSLPISNDFVTSMDASNRYFVMLMDMTENMRMLIFDTEEDSFEIKSVDAKLDIRSMIGFSYQNCDSSSSSDKSNKKKIVEIVVPVVIGSIMIITIIAFFIHRRKRRNYQSIDQ